MKLFITFLVTIGLVAFGADDLPSIYTTGLPNGDWSTTGVPGGIPSVTTISTTLNPGATISQINSAIAAAASNSCVYLTAGTYNLSANQIVIAKDGVVLRGETNSVGFPLTILNSCDVRMAKCNWPSFNQADPDNPFSDVTGSIDQGINSGYTEGSTSITLAANANNNFEVGDLFMMDQTFDGTFVKSSTAGWAHRSGRPYNFIGLVTGKSGATITFTPPLLGQYWNSARTPQAFGWSVLRGHTLKMAGMEDLDIRGNSSSYIISGGPAYGCWLKNIRLNGWATSGNGDAGTRWAYSSQCSIVMNIFRDQAAVSSGSYAVYPTVVSYFDISHNFFTNLALAMPSICMVGSSFTYNAGVGPYPYSPANYFAEYIFPHGGHDHHNLYEGNWFEGPFIIDGITGNNNNDRIAIVRNRLKGWATGKEGGLVPIAMDADMDDIAILSNILGSHEYHTAYSQMVSVDPTCTGIIKTNNYNTVNQGVNSAETHAGGNTTQVSYRLPDTKLGFWGNLPWPSFEPTVTQGTNTLAYTNTPTGFRNYFSLGWPGGESVPPPVEGPRGEVGGKTSFGGKVSFGAQ